jgi:outer membrane biosynthesis protein TonB
MAIKNQPEKKPARKKPARKKTSPKKNQPEKKPARKKTSPKKNQPEKKPARKIALTGWLLCSDCAAANTEPLGETRSSQRASAQAFGELGEPFNMVPLPKLQSKRCGLSSHVVSVPVPRSGK